jgi:hypothetical protein
MRWTEQHQQQLDTLAAEGKSLDEIAAALKRSPEAIAMKLNRLGLKIRENSPAENQQNKVTNSPTTTTTKTTKTRERIKSGGPALSDEAIGLLWAV